MQKTVENALAYVEICRESYEVRLQPNLCGHTDKRIAWACGCANFVVSALFSARTGFAASAGTTLRRDRKDVADEIGPGWKIAGTMMFCIALATPLVLISFHPGLESKISRDMLAKSGPFEGDAEISTRRDASQARNWSRGSGTVLAAAVPEISENELGLLGQLIDDNGPVSISEVQSLRRLILDSVAVDLESEDLVDDLQSLTVPVTDCDGAEGSVEGDLITNGPEIIGALRSLGGEPAGWMTTSEMRLPTEELAYSGLNVEFCPNSDTIAAIEILPVEQTTDPERGEALVAEQMQFPNLPGDVSDSESPKLNAVAMSKPVAKVDDAGLAKPVSVAQSQPSVAQTASVPATGEAPAIPNTGAAGDTGLAVSKPMAESGSPSELADTDVQNSELAQAPVVAKETPAIVEDPVRASPVIVKEVDDSVQLTLNGDMQPVSKDMPLAQTDLSNNAEGISSEAPSDLATVVLETSEPQGVVRADEVSIEEDLDLNKRDRFNAQLRLALVGHDPNGIDGVFGPGTRTAIAGLQEQEALPVTGYLDANTLALLKDKSQPAYLKWRADRRARRARLKAERIAAMAPDQVGKLPAARRAGNCSRNRSGAIIENQSFDCDFNILKESLNSLLGSSG